MADQASATPPTPSSDSVPLPSHPAHLTPTPTTAPRFPSTGPSTGSSELEPILHTPRPSRDTSDVVLKDTPAEITPETAQQHDTEDKASPPSFLDLPHSPPSRASRRALQSPPRIAITPSDSRHSPPMEGSSPKPETAVQQFGWAAPYTLTGDTVATTGQAQLPASLHEALEALSDHATSPAMTPPRTPSAVLSSSPLSDRASPRSSPPPSPASPDPPIQRSHAPRAPVDHANNASSSSSSDSSKSDEKSDTPPRPRVTYLSRKRSIRRDEAPSPTAEDLIEELLTPPGSSQPTHNQGQTDFLSDHRDKRRRQVEGSTLAGQEDVFAKPHRSFPARPSKLAKRYPPSPGHITAQQGRRTAGPSAYAEPEKKVRFATSTRLQGATSDAGASSRQTDTSSPRSSLVTRQHLRSTDQTKSTGNLRPSRPTPDSPRPRLTRRPAPVVQSARDQGMLFMRANPRAVFVAQNVRIKTGQLVTQSTPQHPVLHTRLLESHCAGCLLDTKGRAEVDKVDETFVMGRFVICSRCERVWFCSLKCYAKNAQLHFDECRALVQIKHVPSAEVRLLARACRDRANGKALPSAATLLPLTHYEMLRLAPLIRDLVAFLSRVHRMAQGEEHLNYKEYGFHSIVDLHTFVREVRQHLVPITDAKGFPLGLCLAPTISKFAHSCRPNAHLCWPFGMAVGKPLRVIALDDIDGGEEVTLSHVDLATPLYQRADRLGIKGYRHDCRWCERELKTTDVRWAARHTDCPEEGLIALKDDNPQAHGSRSSAGPACDTCGDLYPETGLDEYGTLMETLEPYLQADAEGTLLVDAAQDDKATTSELAFLEKAVEHLLIGYPDTVHPIPTLHRRLVRIYLQIPTPTLEQFVRPIELLRSVYDAHHLMNYEEPRHITLWWQVEQVGAHLKIIEMNGYTCPGWRGITVERRDGAKRELLSNHLDQAESLIREATSEAGKVFGPSGGGLMIELRRYRRTVHKYQKWSDENLDDGSSWEPVDEVVKTSARRGSKAESTNKRGDSPRKSGEGTMERVMESKENVGRRAIGVGRGGSALEEREGNTGEASGLSSEDRHVDAPNVEVSKGTEMEMDRPRMELVLGSPPGKRRRTY